MCLDEKLFYIREIIKMLVAFFAFELFIFLSFVAGIGLRYLLN